jgi:hypothetical protein
LNTHANSIHPDAKHGEAVRTAPGSNKPDLKDPAVILELLEADQVVAAKQQSRFGSRTLSPGLRAMLWGLRGYVLVMIVIVVISVIRAAHATP